MSLELEPDVAFGSTSEFGIAAAVADDRPFLDEVLRRHHFEYNARLDAYLLPSGISHNAAVQNVAAATHEFQDAGLSVATDPRAVIPPTVLELDDAEVQKPVPGQSLTALTAELHELRHPSDVSDRLLQALDEQSGAVGDLEQFIDTAAAWCERLDSADGRELALHLRTIAYHVSFLGDQLHGAALEMDDMPEGAPPLAEGPLLERHTWLPVTHTARSRAAVASSPHRPSASPKPPTAEAVRPPAAPPHPRRTR